MTGAMMGLMASVGSGSPPDPPLTCSVSLLNDNGVFNVSGTSGDIYTQGNAVIVPLSSGGTPPYTGSVSVKGDASGKIYITPASDGVHNTLGWSGFSVGETELCYIQNGVSDSAGNHVTSRYPPTGQTIAIKRTS